MSLINSSNSGLTVYKQFLFVLIKLSIVFGAGYFIYYKLTSNRELDIELFKKTLNKHNLLTAKNIAFLALFSTANWLVESYKWKTIVANFKKISFLKAIEQSLGSLTASIITPNRIGEYGAKAIYYEKALRKKILGITLIGNLSQMLWTLLLGSISIIYFTIQYKPEVNYHRALKILVLLIMSIYLFLYLGKKTSFSFKGYSLTRLKEFSFKLSKKSISLNLLLAGLRYLIFSHQFYWLLTIFNIQIPYTNALALISCMYLLSSIVPTIFIFDVVVKSSIAVWLFSFENANELLILVITSLMWIANFAIPSLFGSYFVLNFKVNLSNSE